MRERVVGLLVAHRALLVVLALGAVLRIWLFTRWSPAFMGFSDSAAYLTAVEGGTWFNEPLRPIGYPLVLGALRLFSDSLAWIAGVQHILGLVTAVLVYTSLLRLGAPRWAGVLAAAVPALHGTLISLEHAILAETAFVAFVVAGLLAAVWAGTTVDDRRAVALAAVAGLLLAGAGAIRTNGILLVGVGAAYLVWAGGRSWKPRLASGAACLVAGGVLLVTNLVLMHDATGSWSFSWRDAYQSYGRVASFADCSAFDPPPRTEPLCPTMPRAERPGAAYWLYDVNSPLLQRYGGAHGGHATPADLKDIRAFTRAAILGQPLAYADTVRRDLFRLLDPHFPLNPNPEVANSGAGYLPEGLLDQLVAPTFEAGTLAFHRGGEPHRGTLTGWRSYHRVTLLTGLPMLVLLVLAGAAPFLLRGPARRGAVLFASAAGILLVVPVMGLSWNWRYQVVALPPLAATAALGAWGAARRGRSPDAPATAADPSSRDNRAGSVGRRGPL